MTYKYYVTYVTYNNKIMVFIFPLGWTFNSLDASTG